MTDQSGNTLPRQRVLSQKRGQAAWALIQSRLENYPMKGKYLQVAKSASADVQANGLGQTLAFWRAKGKNNSAKYYEDLLIDLSSWLSKQKGITHRSGETIDWIINENTTVAQYRQATTEAIAFLIWMRRFAEAEQVVEGEDDDNPNSQT